MKSNREARIARIRAARTDAVRQVRGKQPSAPARPVHYDAWIKQQSNKGKR